MWCRLVSLCLDCLPRLRISQVQYVQMVPHVLVLSPSQHLVLEELSRSVLIYKCLSC
jgi:hypothetical protein